MSTQLTSSQAEKLVYNYYVYMIKKLEKFVTQEFWENNKNLCLPIIGSDFKDQIFLWNYSEDRLKVIAGNNIGNIDYSNIKFIGKRNNYNYKIENKYVVKYVENAWKKFEHRSWQWNNNISNISGEACHELVYPLVKIMLENFNPPEKIIWGMSGSKSWINREDNKWHPIYGPQRIDILVPPLN